MTALLLALPLAAFVALLVATPRCMQVGRHARGESLRGW